MKVLVTGGGGFVGGRVARLLRERGDEVTVLGRREYPRLAAEGIHGVRADVRDQAVVRRAVRGKDVVFHVAAKVGIWGPLREFRQVNVEGTRNVIEACRAEKVAKLLFTSTPSVVFGRDDLCGVDETQPYPDRHLCDYAATKAGAEQQVLRANDDQLATIALRPHLVWGPGDTNLIPRIVERARAGRLVQVGTGRNLVDLTYIDNAAAAHVQAADALAPGSANAGRAYFISDGAPVRVWDWLRRVLAAIGAPPSRRSVSFRKAYYAGAVLEGLYRVFGVTSAEPPMTRFLACQLAKSHYFSIAGARRDFGYEPAIGNDEGVARLVAWFRDAEPARRAGKPAALPGADTADAFPQPKNLVR